MKIDPRLREFATVRQLEFLEAIETHGSTRAAAKAMGLNKNTVQDSISRLKTCASLRGYSPKHDLTRPVAPGQTLRGASTLYRRGEAEPVLQWVKSKADDEQRDRMIREAVAALMDDVPRADPLPFAGDASEDLCTVYTLTDCHVGMRAWGKETGADWDLGIAERVLTGAFGRMIDASPAADKCVIAQLGDWLHFDGLTGVTPASGHVLDVDSRFSKCVGVAVRILRWIVNRALSKHRQVVLLVADANHDPASGVWLRHMFTLLYELEPRVSVIDGEIPFYVYQHGKTMLGWHHGHTKKPTQLPLLFAAQFPREWGATLRRYVHCGHLHHVDEKEHNGVIVIQHPTIAARDSYAARHGWVADRSITAITYHAEFGQVSRTTVVPEMLMPA
jgi:hypothetical protein